MANGFVGALIGVMAGFKAHIAQLFLIWVQFLQVAIGNLVTFAFAEKALSFLCGVAPGTTVSACRAGSGDVALSAALPTYRVRVRIPLTRVSLTVAVRAYW